MKRIQITDSLRLIKSRKAAFFTLTLIIALGLGVFLATRESEKSMKVAGKHFFREQCQWDLEIVSPRSAAQDDVEVIRNLPEVSDAEGMWNISGTIGQGDSAREIQIVSMTQRISLPVLLTGRLPVAANECALEPDVLEAAGVKVGDTIKLEPMQGEEVFSAGYYVITGTVYHPDYLAHDLSDVAVVASGAFLKDHYGRIAVVVKGTEEMDPFSDEYLECVQEGRKVIEGATKELTAGLPIEMRDNLRWIVLDRKANTSYVSYISTAEAYSSVGLVFGILFLLVIALECFGCVAVIVEDEKSVIGVKKAFGFYASEILKKYTIFGAASAITGSVLGILLSYLLSSWILVINDKVLYFVIRATKPEVMPVLIFTVCLGTIFICVVTATVSCLKLLKSPAELLLKGADLRSGNRVACRGGRNRSLLYLRMILRNITTDFSRVALSIAVVAVSCVLIGGGVTVKLGFSYANQRQLSDILLYDVKLGIDEGISEEKREALEEKMNALGVDWCSVRWENRMFDNKGIWDGTIVICSADNKLNRMIGLIDPKTGKNQDLPNDGALIQCRIAENLQLSGGDKLIMLDDDFKKSICPIAGSAINYSFRMVVMNREVYDKTFGIGKSDNCYLILLGDVPEELLRKELLSVTEDLTFENSDAFYEEYKSVVVTYNAIMIGITVIAVLISFVILINLASIHITRKKRELVILRMNGFNLRMCKAYVAYDAILITTVGLVLGVIGGIPVANMSVHIMERDYLQFVRGAQPEAWIAAVVIEVFFTLIIYAFAMRKIRYYEIGDLSDAK